MYNTGLYTPRVGRRDGHKIVVRVVIRVTKIVVRIAFASFCSNFGTSLVRWSIKSFKNRVFLWSMGISYRAAVSSAHLEKMGEPESNGEDVVPRARGSVIRPFWLINFPVSPLKSTRQNLYGYYHKKKECGLFKPRLLAEKCIV